MTKPRLVSARVACCWIPWFALRVEEARVPGLATRPAAILSPEDPRHVWQVSPLARRAGVKPGLTVSQAIGLCPELRLCEPDPVHYDAQFTLLLTALVAVSPVVEPAGLGRVYVGTDGLEKLYGAPEEIVEAITCVVRTAQVSSFVRLGLGTGKFVSWVAASRARPGHAVIVPAGVEAAFLATQPLAVLPLAPDAYRRLRRLGLRTLGDLAALPEEAVASQFGATGRQWWRLAAGALVQPAVGCELPEPIAVSLTFFSPVADRGMLAHALERLLARALKHPRRSGWRIHSLRVRAELERGASWMIEVVLKEPTAERDRLAAPILARLEQAPPAKAVERLAVELTGFAPGTDELQLFARDANAAARAGRRRALAAAVREVALRLRRTMLFHVIEVEPWSRIPERRYALIDFEA